VKSFLVLPVACASLLIVSGAAASSAAPARSSAALSAFTSAWDGVTAYSATITVFEQQGVKVQNVIFKYTFRKPSTVTVDVVGGPNNGASLLWTGGATVSAHRGSGLMGAFKKTLSLHDPQITTIRGSSIDELSFAQILAHAQQTSGPISQGPGLTINGVATDAVTLIPTHPTTNAGYTREVIEISRTTHFPLRVLGYEGPTLVRKIDFVDVKLTS
jgi:outer membrane lipoprotein-sorting protein